LTWKYNRTLLFKSPPHTGRIRLLLEAFPDAKFVHIHRDPYRVFQSTQRLHRSLAPYSCLQTPDEKHLNDRIIRNYKEMYDVFFEERQLIPDGRYHEICFEQLELAPFEEIRRTYDALQLPAFSSVEEPLREYIASLDGYKKNSFARLPDDLRQRLGREWRTCFDAWGYER
jgi:omega-hydroxy-beta-dihydromenaquinone-9 sulfotransferase